MTATYLVTGGAGFIGSHIVERLVADGATVRLLDNFSTGRRENLAAVTARVEIIEGDLADLAVLREAMAGVDYVFHEAAMASVPKSVAQPAEAQAINATGTLNVLLCAREAQVKRVVYASTSAVYGNEPTLPKREAMRPMPESPYALTKLSGEQWCGVFSSLYGLETVALRYFNVYGPRQDPQSEYAAVIPKFVERMVAGERPRIFGDGTQSRDFIYVGDVVEANLQAMHTPNIAGRYFNLASGQVINLLTLVQELNTVLGTDLAPDFAPERPGDIKHSYADVSEIRQALGFQAQMPLREGLRATVEFFRP